MRESYDKPLRGSAMARLTFLAAVAAEPDTAKERLGLYEEVIHEVGPVDQDAERLVSIARRLMAANSPAHQMCPPAALDFEEFFPAYEALAEGMRSNLVHGEAGASWLRGIASQMHFSIWPSWVWWPVHALLALIEARDGHVTAAREWLWKVPIPEPMDLVVKAYIALADGRPQEARRMAEEVLATSARCSGCASTPWGCSSACRIPTATRAQASCWRRWIGPMRSTPWRCSP